MQSRRVYFAYQKSIYAMHQVSLGRRKRLFVFLYVEFYVVGLEVQEIRRPLKSHIGSRGQQSIKDGVVFLLRSNFKGFHRQGHHVGD